MFSRMHSFCLHLICARDYLSISVRNKEVPSTLPLIISLFSCINIYIYIYWQLRIFGGQFPRSHKLLATQDFWGPVPKITQAQGAYWQLRIFGGQFPRSHKLKVPTGNSGFLGASSQDHTSSRCLLATQDFWGPVPKITKAQGVGASSQDHTRASSQDHTSSRRLLATQDFWGPVPKIMPTGNSGFLGASSQDHRSSRCLLATQDFWGPVPKITQAQGAYWQLRIFGGQFPRSHKLKVPTGNSGFLGASSQDHASSRCLLATQDFWGPVPKITQAQGAYWQLRIFGGQFPRSHKLKVPTGNSGFLGASSQDHKGAYWQLRIFGG